MSEAAKKPTAKRGRTKRPMPGISKSGASKSAAEARRLQFIEEYVANGGNGTRAAIAVGFAPAGARVQACRMLTNPNVVAAIKQRRIELQKRYELTAEDIVQKLAQMVHLDISTLYDEDGTLKPVHLWPPEAASCVQAIEAGPKGVMKVKTVGRLDALVAAMKHLGMFDKDNRQRASDPIKELMDHVAAHNQWIPVKP